MSTSVTWPQGSEAWFVCRAAGIVDDVMLPLAAGASATETEISTKGRIKAARVFKRRHGFHPSRKIDCEFQMVETTANSKAEA